MNLINQIKVLSGAATTSAGTSEVDGATIDMANFVAGQGRSAWGTTVPSELGDKLCLTTRHPVGVVGMITPGAWVSARRFSARSSVRSSESGVVISTPSSTRRWPRPCRQSPRRISSRNGIPSFRPPSICCESWGCEIERRRRSAIGAADGMEPVYQSGSVAVQVNA